MYTFKTSNNLKMSIVIRRTIIPSSKNFFGRDLYLFKIKPYSVDAIKNNPAKRPPSIKPKNN